MDTMTKSRPARKIRTVPLSAIDREPIASDDPTLVEDGVLCSPLPCVDGRGLSEAEVRKLNAAENTVRARYSADVPDASWSECFAVGLRARADALRSVLRDRPPAPCCSSLEEAPCLGCSGELAIPGADREMTPDEICDLLELNLQHPEWSIEADFDHWPSFTIWPSNTENWRWAPTLPIEPEPLLTMPEAVEHELARYRSRQNDLGDLLASRIEALLHDIHVTGAHVPDEVDVRLEVIICDSDRETLDRWKAGEPAPEITAGGRYL